MYGGFTDTEFLCGGADRGPVLYDVKSETFRPLLHIFLQTLSLPASDWFILCGGEAGYVRQNPAAAGICENTPSGNPKGVLDSCVGEEREVSSGDILRIKVNSCGGYVAEVTAKDVQR